MQIGSFFNGNDKQVLSNRAAESRRESQVATLKLPVAVRKVYVEVCPLYYLIRVFTVPSLKIISQDCAVYPKKELNLQTHKEGNM